MNSLTLKIIALTAMVIDHMGAAFPETFGLEFRVVGRLAFPIYVFLIAEGFFHTKNTAKFLLRLFAFAVISEPFFDMALNGAGILDVNFFADTNIFYTLFLGGAAVWAYQQAHKWYSGCAPAPPAASRTVATLVAFKDMATFMVIAFAPLFSLMWLAAVLGSDYGAYGVLFVFVMYYLRRNFATVPGTKKMRLIIFAMLCLWLHVDTILYALDYGFGVVPVPFWLMIPATLLTVVPAALYNGKRGPGGAAVKWFFYGAYPVHLAVLAGVRLTFLQY